MAKDLEDLEDLEDLGDHEPPTRPSRADGTAEAPEPEWESFWDRAYAAGDHREHWDPPGVPGELAALVAAGLVPEGGRCADLGCGSGVEAVWLAGRGFRVTGIDSSRRALEVAARRAREAGVEVTWRRASVFDLPLDDASVDLALDRGLLHCLDEDEERDAYGAEVGRVLTPGGLLLLRGAQRLGDVEDGEEKDGEGGEGEGVDDREDGLVAIDAATVDRLFPPSSAFPRGPVFTRGPIVPIDLVAPAGTVPGVLVLVQKVGGPGG